MTIHTVTISPDGPEKLRLRHERRVDGKEMKPIDPADRIPVDRRDQVFWVSNDDTLSLVFEPGKDTNPFDPVDKKAEFTAEKGLRTVPEGVVSDDAPAGRFLCNITLGKDAGKRKFKDTIGVDIPGS